MRFSSALRPLRIFTPVLLVAAAATLSGCVLGNSADVSVVRNTTIGQELLDLEEARAKGAISNDEYAELKEKIKEMADPPNVSYSGESD